METPLPEIHQIDNDKSHLTIPRKGMETISESSRRDIESYVALNYSPQGDGNYSPFDLLSNIAKSRT